VQTMVDAEYAGVLFTEHPSNAGSMMIELVAGLGDDLVSGRATPKGFAYGRLTHDLLQDEEPPIDLQGLINLAVKAETLFGCAQDIEWAYAGGEFYLLQARNVTASTSRREDQVGIREAERGRLVALAKKSLEVEGSELLGMNELSELLPRPTPMSLAMMNALWAPGGSVDLACRSFGIGYNALQESPSLVEGAFGTLWINCKEMGRRESDVSLLVAFRMARGAEMISSRFREEILPAIERNTRWIEWSQLEKRSGPELVSLFEELRTRFLTETYVEAERINIAADVYMGGARRRLEREDLDPAEYLSHMPVTVVSEAFELLPAIRRGEATVSDFLVHYGHRAPHDFELSEPRYRENHAAVTELSDLTAGSILHESEHDSQASVPSGRLTALEVQRARDFQALKEEAKHGALREYAALRRILLALGHVSELGEDIFWLEPDELQLIEFDSKAVVPRELLECIELRQRRFQAFADLDLPSTITIQNLERMNLTGTGPALDRERDGGELQGLHVAGAHDVVGLVRKLDCAADLSTFKTGEILVTRFTDPSWTAVFPRAGGLVTEVGGWLSHAAIQAREYGLSCIVGAEGARDAFETGDLVRLATDGSVELLSNRRRHERQQLEGKRGYTVEVAVRGQVLKANLIDLSKAGAGLQVSEGALELEESVEFRGLNRAPLSARVVRRGENGDIGIQFDRELDEIPDALETVA
jgi:rifampicin phosphotransferase